MDTKHTPAPWTVCVHDTETTVEAASQTVCAFVSNCDANLIAVAPEMLAELERLAEHFGWDEKHPAVKLIAKAKGET